MFNPNKTPQDRLHVWIVSVCGDGTCALKLYQDLLWTVWYSQRECGLKFSSVALYRERVHKPRTRTISVIEYWATMNTHSYTHVWALEAWRIGQRLKRTLWKWRIELIKNGSKRWLFPGTFCSHPNLFYHSICCSCHSASCLFFTRYSIYLTFTIQLSQMLLSHHLSITKRNNFLISLPHLISQCRKTGNLVLLFYFDLVISSMLEIMDWCSQSLFREWSRM